MYSLCRLLVNVNDKFVLKGNKQKYLQFFFFSSRLFETTKKLCSSSYHVNEYCCSNLA